MSLDVRGLVNGLAGDVGVEFLGEVIVFALHLCAEAVNAVVDICIHFAEPGIYIGVHLFKARIHISVEIFHALVKTYPHSVHILSTRFRHPRVFPKCYRLSLSLPDQRVFLSILAIYS